MWPYWSTQKPKPSQRVRNFTIYLGASLISFEICIQFIVDPFESAKELKKIKYIFTIWQY